MARTGIGVLVVAAMSLVCGCEDAALVRVNQSLDVALATNRAKSKLLTARAMEFETSAPADPIASGSVEDVRQHLGALGISDEITVEHAVDRIVVHLEGQRGRPQALASILRLGVDAPLLQIEAFVSNGMDWKMKLSVARSVEAEVKTSSTTSIDIPPASFWSFSKGERLHAQAIQKQRELDGLRKVIALLESREAKQRASTAALVDLAVVASARKRRHFTMNLLPRIQDGSLSIAEGRATWSGDSRFETLDQARSTFSGIANVVGFAPGERGSLTAELGE